MLSINGQWREATGETLTSFNPATEEIVWQGNAASPDDVQAAFQAAATAQQAWKLQPEEDRAAVLKRFAELVQANKESLAQAISDEVGKPLWDALSEVGATAAKANVTIDAYQRRRDREEVSLPDRVGRTAYRPLGVVSVFGPFNFPAHIANGQIMPALLAGNAVVFKPSELTPLVAERMVRLWEEAGLPPGVLNLVQGGVTTGQAILQQPELRGLFFTGSRNTGIKLRRALVERLEVLLALELGGNNPLVVHQPSDLNAAAETIIQSAYLTSGQRCTCVRRLIVTGDSSELLDLLVAKASQLPVGLPSDRPEPFLGPLVHATAVDRVRDEQRRLIGQGAVSLLEAKRQTRCRALVSPGIVDVTNGAERTDDEIFGPLLQVIRVPDLEAAIQEANATQFGLAAGILCDRQEDFEQFRQQVHAGLINWNLPTTGASGRLPFGGIGQSGNYRPAGYHAIDFCQVAIAELESAPSQENTQ
ncbi:succinylglutamate-semialdehyde dehydrogenase [Blastopirellula marina]|uniref:Succinylglutamate-semialdehyde dehydrogenase n=1 Tax=Blastopirellula marina TaxID=124 RepID=A0A2S8G9P6_9BACT|nr:succinylglutamate-semialdehyde dehydrogenase [Blastopirellula marina]PQO41186.1 succinylglutamate-semialdehyde dehydrogenase [Blastopirellula marina]PTL46062.1 succinylglutamate-semialdehyde dehydrogenase [Blastopirellula marina]